MDKNKTAAGSSGIVEALTVSFIVAGAAAAVLLTNFNGQGRLWDTLTARFSEPETPAQPTVARVGGDAIASDRMMVVPDKTPAPVESSVQNVAVGKPAEPAKKKNWVKHIEGSLTMFDPHSAPTQHAVTVTVAPQASVAPAPAAVPAPASAAAAPKVAAATPAPAARAYVNYGSSARSDIMSGASGPVYNFTGKK